MTSHHEEQTLTTTLRVASVRFFEVGKLYHFSFDHLPDLKVGDYVVVETTRGRQLGQVMNLVEVDPDTNARGYKPILRRATPTDMMSQKLWKSREVEALITCREKAAQMGGYDGVKFVAAQYNFEGSLLTFLFSAEEKINTNKLRSALRRSFRTKVELRQIGPRDVAKVLGGMGACGIPRCCSTFLTDFSPISIKMAKAQGISLNPSEITGMCGRLRCCLIYEYEQYVEARKHLPKRNKRIGTPHGEGKVLDVHPLRDAVTVIVDDTRHLVPREDLIPLEEWEALKAKAQAGCTKAESGGCDCGARPVPETDSPAAAQPPTEPTAPEGDTAKEGQEKKRTSDKGRGPSRRRHSSGRRRGRSRRNRRPPRDRKKTDSQESGSNEP